MAGAIRWGILSTGWIAQSFTSDLVLGGHTVAAVGSRTIESATRFAAGHGIPVAYGSYQELVRDPDVDIVYVATPHTFHAENAILALAAGKHVLVEKPFSVNAREAKEVVDLGLSRGLLVMEAMWTRFLPHVVRIREILAAGTLGEVSAFQADHTQNVPKDPAHRMNAPELGGGALLDLGIYPISFASHLFGTPHTVQSAATFQSTGVDARVAANFQYADGQMATTYSALDARGRNSATILGSKARIEIDATWYAPTSFRVIATDGEILETFETSITGRGMQYEAIEAERLIAAGQTGSPLMSPDETVSIMRTLDEIRSQIGLVYPGE